MWSPALHRRFLDLVLCVVIAASGCSNAADPEKAEKPENSTPAQGGADVQTREMLAERVASVERQLEPLRRAARADPDNPVVHLALGKTATRVHVFDEGIAHLERAVELEPSVAHRLDLAVGYTLAAQPDKAIEIYEQVLHQEPGNATALHELGNIALGRTEYERAIAYFGRALQAKPDYLLAQLHLADALRDSGRHREAYRGYERVIVLEATTPFEARGVTDALYGLAALDLMMGAHERAGTFLQELIRMAPEHDKAYYAYGQVLLHLGRPEQAQQMFDKHIAIQAKTASTSAAAMGD